MAASSTTCGEWPPVLESAPLLLAAPPSSWKGTVEIFKSVAGTLRYHIILIIIISPFAPIVTVTVR
jgi:hypothetical protein